MMQFMEQKLRQIIKNFLLFILLFVNKIMTNEVFRNSQ